MVPWTASRHHSKDSFRGVGVVGVMVLFTTKRAELLQRYERMRSLLDTWDE